MIEEVTRQIIRCDWCERTMKRSGLSDDPGPQAVFLTREDAQEKAQTEGWDLPDGRHWCGCEREDR